LILDRGPAEPTLTPARRPGASGDRSARRTASYSCWRQHRWN